jgi:flotillin
MPEIFSFTSGPVLAVVALFVILILLASYVASRYRVANANEALIVAGSRGAKVRAEKGQVAATGGSDDKGIRVVVGGGTFVLPLVHKVGRLKLTARQIEVRLGDAVTSQGIKVAVQGVATFKIGRDVESIRNAAERFLDARDEQVDSIVKNVLEGSLRSIVGTLTIEELIMDRQKLLQQVQDSAKGDLETSGLQIDAFTIQSIGDDSGYIDLLGQQKLSVVERDARMARAGADQQAAVREAEAEQVKINAQRDVSLRRAETETQTAAAEARAAQAGPLAMAESQQEVVRKQTELAELEAARKQQELVASTVRPAEAEAEAGVRRAEGDRAARIAAAQADAESQKLAGQAEAAVIQVRGEAQARVVSMNAQAEAERTTLEGNAEAGVVLTKGEAEARALGLKAEAYKQFNEAAVIQTVLGMLPEIVRAAAEPMASIDSLTVLSNDGATEVVRNATRAVTETSATVKGLTGLDVPALIGGALGTAGRDGGAPAPGPAAGGAPARRRAAEPGSGAAAAAGMSAPPSIGAPSAATPATGYAAPATSATGTPTPATAADGAGSEAARVQDALDSASAAVDRAARAAGNAGAASDRSDRVRRQAEERLAQPDIGITQDTPLSEALTIAATQLGRVPGIERHRALRLSDLDSHGPAPARAVWRIARERLGQSYGSLTIGDLLERYRARRPDA